MAKEEEIEEEKLKAALEKAKSVDIDKMMRAFVEMFRAYSEMIKRIGLLERDNKDAFDSMAYLGSIAPQFLKALAKRAPPAEFGAFIQAFLDLFEIAPKLDEIMKLPAEEKIQIAEKLGKIADTLEEMIIRVENQKKVESKHDVQARSA